MDFQPTITFPAVSPKGKADDDMRITIFPSAMAFTKSAKGLPSNGPIKSEAVKLPFTTVG